MESTAEVSGNADSHCLEVRALVQVTGFQRYMMFAGAVVYNMFGFNAEDAGAPRPQASPVQRSSSTSSKCWRPKQVAMEHPGFGGLLDSRPALLFRAACLSCLWGFSPVAVTVLQMPNAWVFEKQAAGGWCSIEGQSPHGEQALNPSITPTK